MGQTIRFDNGDIEIDSTGGQTLIESSEKGAMDLLHEIFLPYDVRTDRGNEMFESDGSLTSIVGGSSIGAQAVRTFLKSAVKRLQRLQQQDSNVARNELVQEIKSIVVQQINNDVTSYGFYLSVVIDDENMAVSRAIRTQHLGNTTRPLVGGYDP